MTDSAAYKIPEVKECVGYEKLGSTEIRLENLDAFIECAKYYKIEKIWSCYAPLCDKFKTADGKSLDFERTEPFPEIFFFVINNVIHSLESRGYKLLHDYIAAKEMGFLDYRVHGLIDKVSKKYEVKSAALLYYKAVKYGFKNLEEFEDSFNFYDEFKSFSTYQEERYLSAKLGFEKKNDWIIAKSKGFKNGMEYYDAIELGIDNACDYHDYKILFNEKFKYGFQKPFEFHIFHIINRHMGQRAIPINEIFLTWKIESFYYGEEWYSIKNEEKTEDRLKMILSTNQKFLYLGKIENEQKEFVLYRNDTIYVDGSNVAWNNQNKKNGGKPHSENIRIVVDSLRKKGFKNVVAICDSNLEHDIDDPEIYTELVNNKILTRVRSRTTADYWILKFKQDRDIFIVTNDGYREFRDVYKDLESHLIKFHVNGKEAVFYDNIESITDKPKKENLLPELCRQKINSQAQ